MSNNNNIEEKEEQQKSLSWKAIVAIFLGVMFLVTVGILIYMFTRKLPSSRITFTSDYSAPPSPSLQKIPTDMADRLRNILSR